MFRNRCFAILAASMLGLALVSIALAISGSQIDDFEDGTTMGWVEGLASPNSPQNAISGGPAGADDNWLSNQSSGGGAAGSKMVMFNTSQWTGDYVAAGVQQIEMDMANFGISTLEMRIALRGAGDTWSSTNSFTLPNDQQWRSVVFMLDKANMTRLSGVSDLNTALSDVTELRILSSPFPAFQGEPVFGFLGVDNILASTVPVELQTFTVE